MQHKAIGDVDDVGGTLLVQAQDDAPGRAADGEVDAAALPWQAGGERQRVGRREPGLAQRMCQQAGLPGAVVGVSPMLQHAAAAAPEVAAGRRDPGLAGIDDRFGDRVPAIAPWQQRPSVEGLVWQGQRQIERRAVGQARHAVAFGSDAVDTDHGRFRRFTAGGSGRAQCH